MKFLFAAILICIAVLAAVCFIAVTAPSLEIITGSGSYYSWKVGELYYLPPCSRIAWRLAIWWPISLAVTLGALMIFRRLPMREMNFKIRMWFGLPLLACSAWLVYYTFTDYAIFAFSDNQLIRAGYWLVAGAAVGAAIAIAIWPQRWQIGAKILIWGAFAGSIICTLIRYPVPRE